MQLMLNQQQSNLIQWYIFTSIYFNKPELVELS